MKRLMSSAGYCLRLPITLAIMTMVSACTLGPDFKIPLPPRVNGYTPTPLPKRTAAADGQTGKAQDFSATRDIPAQWWQLFRSPQLNALINKAFEANPTIASAQATLRQAQENVYAEQGYFFPTIQASYTPSRIMLSGNGAAANAPGMQGNGISLTPYQGTPANQGGKPPYNEPLTYNWHSAQLTVGFVPDVFGVNRRQVESLQAQAEAQRFQLEATYVTLASNVVAAAIQEAALRAQIAAVRQIVRLQAQSLAMLRLQHRFGYASRLDVVAQETAMAQARQLLPPLRRQLEQTRDLIRLLAGNAPDQDVAQTFSLATLHLPQHLPLSLPSRLVEQRPDVRAAEAMLHAATADVGIAEGEMLPQFSINASAGGEAMVFNQMFLDPGRFFSILGSASQSIFSGGTLLHRKRAAQQALLVAQARYRSTVLTAFQNVADTLHALYADADALKTSEQLEKSARKALEITRKQQRRGYVGELALINAEQAYQQVSIGLVQSQATRFGDTAALFQALGGGWWNMKGESSKPNARN